MMSDPGPKELTHAEDLMNNGKVEEALEIVINFEKMSELTPKDRLSALILKGNIYTFLYQFNKAVEAGELAYTMSQKLGLVPESIAALILKSMMIRLGNVGEALKLILEAEKLFNIFIVGDLSEVDPERNANLNLNLKLTKSWVYVSMGDYEKALELAIQNLTLGENLTNNVLIGLNLFLVGYIYYAKGDYDQGLEYIMKSLKLFENLEFKVGIAAHFSVIGEVYLNMGELNRALEFSNKALSIEKISDYSKNMVLSVLGRIYQNTGELDKALMYFKSIEMTEENYINMVKTYGIGEISRMKGENEIAIMYFKQSMLYSEKVGNDILMLGPLFYLILISLDNNSIKQAHLYLKRLEIISKLFKNEMWGQQIYSLGKGFILKASSRMHDHVDAERLFKQIIEDEFIFAPFNNIALVSLCELLLEELSMYNNPEVLDDITPLIIKHLDIAEKQNSFSWLAEGKVLQAKLALVQLDLDKAKILLREAQQIAEEYELKLLAQKISNEYDLLLEKAGEWEKLNREDAPMADRIELASFDGVINRLHGKQVVDPPELVDEEPILLTIMDNSGSTYLNHPFITNWDHSDLFSSFLSAFNTFSDEIFSKSIDRIKVGENTILINPVESFLACYVIKGQSYPALQKLTRFTEAIRENMEIWNALNKSVKTSEILELDKPPALKTLINEIFA
jgi:tetratricopeptide (TPR) repeat protein